MKRMTSLNDNVPALYLTEAEVARAVLGHRASEWKAIAIVEERQGLPRIDPLFGGRYWPAVKAYLDKRHGLVNDEVPATAIAGETWPDAGKTTRRAR